MEAWTEVNLVPVEAMGESLLTGLIAGLVHTTFRDELETWFFFREPELRLRLRWAAPAHAARCRSELAAALDEAVRRGELI